RRLSSGRYRYWRPRGKRGEMGRVGELAVDTNKVIVTRVIEPDLGLYESFFDHAWAEDLSARIHSRLADSFDSLSLAWKEAANTHRLPWLMIHQMESFAGGFMRRSKADMAVMIEQFKAWLFREMNGKLQRVEKKAINAAIK